MFALRHLIIAVSLALALGATRPASAQSSAPTATSATPAPNCEKPGDPPAINRTEMGRSAAEASRNTWFKNMKAYVDCLKAFVIDEQAAAAPHIKAANAAAEELNRSIKLFNEQMDASKQ